MNGSWERGAALMGVLSPSLLVDRIQHLEVGGGVSLTMHIQKGGVRMALLVQYEHLEKRRFRN